MATAAKTTKATAAPADKNEELQVQIARLKEEIAAIASTLKDIGTEKVEGAKQSASGAYDDAVRRGEAAVDDVRRQIHDIEDQLSAAVREKPLTSLAIAAGVGYLLALMARR